MTVLIIVKIPSVDWIVQFDPPDDPRVSRRQYYIQGLGADRM